MEKPIINHRENVKPSSRAHCPMKMAIVGAEDVVAARRTVRSMATEIGFTQKECEEISLCVSELAGNIVKFAATGSLSAEPLMENGRQFIRIEARDEGPGIRNIEDALTDGFSTSGGLGCGLGTVQRMMDRMAINSPVAAGRGTCIVAEKWRQPFLNVKHPFSIDIGAATRAYPGMRVNGDAFVIKQWNGSTLVGVIDGLGHGKAAQQASQRARRCVEDFHRRPLLEIFRNTQRACRVTRGVVMALARFDWTETDAGQQADRTAPPGTSAESAPYPMTISFASVGNIESRVVGGPEPIKFLLRRGIIGKNAPNPIVTRHGWSPQNAMVLHSDGLTSRWHWKDFGFEPDKPATAIARQLLDTLGKDNDDATVLVVKSK